jgi:hypothetical protein
VNRLFWLRARVGQAAPTHGQERADDHVTVSRYLAGQSRLPKRLLQIELVVLCLSHLLGFARQKDDPAGSTVGIAAAAMQDINPVCFQGVHEPGSGKYIKPTLPSTATCDIGIIPCTAKTACILH